MALTDLKVFNQYAYTTFQELLAQNIALFNAGTRGGLTLRGGSNQGDYSDTVIYTRIPGLVRRRDAYGSSTVGAVDITQLQATSVKVAAGTPPVNIDPGWWQWIQRSPDEAGVVLGTQLAEDTLKDMVNTSIKALVAALTNVGVTVVSDGTGANLSLNALNTGAALFGDRAQQILAWLIHSKPMFDLFGSALTNANILFNFGNVQIREDGFGRIFVISDAPDLVYTSSGTKYHTLGLVSAASLVEQNPDYIDNISTLNGKENITRTFQAQWSYNLALKGFQWDKTNGGHSPNDAAIGTGTNWDKYATSIKDTSGVLVNTL